eukprot:SAG11_NODE_399_length_9764_cov_8.760993_2_plen_75_part_00
MLAFVLHLRFLELTGVRRSFSSLKGITTGRTPVIIFLSKYWLLVVCVPFLVHSNTKDKLLFLRYVLYFYIFFGI